MTRGMEVSLLLLLTIACSGAPSADSKPVVRPRPSADPAAVQKLKDAGKEVTPAAFVAWLDSHDKVRDDGREEAELVKLYLAAGIDPNDKGSNGKTPLFAAAGNGRSDFVGLLLKAGADTHARGTQNRTPLHAAAIQGDAPTIGALIAAGAEVDARSDGGYTPFYIAAQNGHVEAMKRLLAKGADVNAKNSVSDGTPLMIAVYNTGPEAIQVLVDAKADLNAVDYAGRSALDMAVDLKRPEAVIELLRKAGAQPGKKKAS
jgi:ankyrin repeat protein